jgi:hypothetical protein
MPLII